MPEYTLRGGRNQNIDTNFAGTVALLNYYQYASQYRNCWVTLNFDGINFIDANLCAFLYGIIFKLNRTRNVRTYIDFRSLSGDLNVLIRNGFTNHIAGNQSNLKPFDNRDTTIPLHQFSQANVDSYCDYIERDFLHQRSLRKVMFDDKERITSSYLEIFDNVGLHANTTDPIFVCGQYFPQQCELKFTLVDLGDGFLKKIASYTRETVNITNAGDAVTWALRGNSTKVDAKGGTGLRDISRYCIRTGGSLHIYTDDCYYDLTNKTATTHTVPRPFCGATIHLIFRYLYE